MTPQNVTVTDNPAYGCVNDRTRGWMDAYRAAQQVCDDVIAEMEAKRADTDDPGMANMYLGQSLGARIVSQRLSSLQAILSIIATGRVA